MLLSSIFRVALSTDFFKTMQAYAFLVFLQELYDVYIHYQSLRNERSTTKMFTKRNKRVLTFLVT
jgi:hypothetical protein